ncbi:MAG: hypothetical protein M1453_06395 [Acidobacteria bacterium]|nr:hypothetical protein [Acidobacteriota bacterium]
MDVKACPICGRPFSAVDIVLSEHDAGFQCRNCWNRMQATGDGGRAFGAMRKPRILGARVTAKAQRRKP